MHRCLKAALDAHTRTRTASTTSSFATVTKFRVLIARLVRHALAHDVPLEHLRLPGGLVSGGARSLLASGPAATATQLDVVERTLRLACRHDLPLEALLPITK